MAGATTEQVMQHHEAALLSGNLDELAKDYTDDSVLIVPTETYKGPESIKAAFAALMKTLTPEALANFKVTKQRICLPPVDGGSDIPICRGHVSYP